MTPLWWPLGVRCVTLEDSGLRPFNARLGRAPRWVAGPSSLVGLQRIVRACTARGVRFGVWGAGFGSQGGLCPAGVLLDLRALHHMEIFPEERIVRVGPGVRVGELDARTTPHGLAAVCPRFSGLSVLGATLGGGTGWLSRRWGFGAQGIRAASVVSPDGRVVRATKDYHPDLLWALRGAGQGGFGVVASLDLELREVPRAVWASKITWPMSQAPEVLGRLPAALERVGASLFVFVSLRSRGPRGPSFSISGVWLGEGSRGREVFDGLCGLARGAEIEQGATTYLACQSEFQDPTGRTPSFQWRHGFVRRGESAAWGRRWRAETRRGCSRVRRRRSCMWPQGSGMCQRLGPRRRRRWPRSMPRCALSCCHMVTPTMTTAASRIAPPITLAQTARSWRLCDGCMIR